MPKTQQFPASEDQRRPFSPHQRDGSRPAKDDRPSQYYELSSVVVEVVEEGAKRGNGNGDSLSHFVAFIKVDELYHSRNRNPNHYSSPVPSPQVEVSLEV